MSRIGTRKVKKTQKNGILGSISGNTAENFLTRYARQKNISTYISRKLDQKNNKILQFHKQLYHHLAQKSKYVFLAILDFCPSMHKGTDVDVSDLSAFQS